MKETCQCQTTIKLFHGSSVEIQLNSSKALGTITARSFTDFVSHKNNQQQEQPSCFSIESELSDSICILDSRIAVIGTKTEFQFQNEI